MTVAPHRTLIVACGALAKEIIALKKSFNVAEEAVDLQCLPAGYHNHPEKIVPDLKKILDKQGAKYDRFLVGYGDCGTGGGLDQLLEDYPKAERLPGTHCYAFFAGLEVFEEMMEEELGSFFLTDYLARHFETLIIKGLGLDRHPNLKTIYFEHYKRLVYLSQAPDQTIVDKAKKAADFLDLDFEHRPVGYGVLQSKIAALPKSEPQHV